MQTEGRFLCHHDRGTVPLSVYEQAVTEVNNTGISAYEKFADRLGAVLNNTSGIGWGFHDNLWEIYNELEW